MYLLCLHSHVWIVVVVNEVEEEAVNDEEVSECSALCTALSCAVDHRDPRSEELLCISLCISSHHTYSTFNGSILEGLATEGH